MGELPYLDDKCQNGRTLDKHARELFMLEHTYMKRCYKKHEQIYLDLDKRTVIYLASGQLKIYASNEQGTEKLLYYLGEGNTCLGNYINENNGVLLSMVAATPCLIYYLDIDTLLKTYMTRENAISNLMDQVEGRMSTMVHNLLDVASCSNKGKIGKLIYTLAERSTKSINGDILLKRFPTRSDIASFIGTHKSNVIKCLKELEREGIIEKYEKGYIIKDGQALEEIIAEEYNIC